MFVIDGPAVVGVYKAEIPDFSPLVKIGDAGRGDLQQRLRERIEHPGARDRGLEFGEIFRERAVWRQNL